MLNELQIICNYTIYLWPSWAVTHRNARCVLLFRIPLCCVREVLFEVVCLFLFSSKCVMENNFLPNSKEKYIKDRPFWQGTCVNEDQ